MTNSKKIVVATHNAHKLSEIRAILSIPGWDYVSLDELGISDVPVEDADSFVGNARIKARFAHERTGLAALADDSGLVVDALGGAPGVHSSRYAGEGSSDTDNNTKLLQEMEGLTGSKRGARFVCAMVFIDTDGGETVAEGSFAGRIGYEPQGENGFGYDPLFYLEASDYKHSVAELGPGEKNAISHRAQALRHLRDMLAYDEAADIAAGGVGDSMAPGGTLAANPGDDDKPACTIGGDISLVNTLAGSSSGDGKLADMIGSGCNSNRTNDADNRSAYGSESAVGSPSCCEDGPSSTPLSDPLPSPLPDSLPAATSGTKRHVVAFDFDGTLIDVSSPTRLIMRLNRDHIMSTWAVLKSIAWGIRYKMGMELDQTVPRRYVFASFKDFPVSKANAIMKDLYRAELRKRLRPQAVAALKAHQAKGSEVIVVSASFDPIISELCKDMGIESYICTQMEVVNGSYTGETVGPPPESEQKLYQFVAWADSEYGPDGWVLTHAYGDHYSDVSLMEIAQHPIAIDPDRRLKNMAAERGWETHDWPIQA